jgi:hypothetical protein
VWQLKVEWKTPATEPFPSSAGLVDYMRGEAPGTPKGPAHAFRLRGAMDATGARIRRAPFRAERVKQALASA